jgi:hypothetical protein
LRRIIICLCSIIAVLMFSEPVRAQGSLFVSPVDTTALAGDEFEVRIEIDAAFLSLMGYDIVVAFDSSLVQLLSVTEGSLPPTGPSGSFFFWFDPAVPNTLVHVNGAVLGTTVDGPGVLFRIRFKALVVGVTPMVIAFSDIRDNTNAAIPHNVLNTTVVIDAPIPVEAATWGRVKALYQP